MVDHVAASVFRAAMEDAANTVCCDSGEANPQWASISHGVYLSIGASGVHRSLGVKVSYVQSTTLDSWKPLHLRMMQLGGNRRFNEFLRQHNVPESMPIREKYSTRAARWYREALRAEAEGTPLPEPLPEGTGHLPDKENLSATDQLLNQVFAQVPKEGAMTRGGVQAVSRENMRGGAKRPRQSGSSSQCSVHSDDDDGAVATRCLSSVQRGGAKRTGSSGTNEGDGAQSWVWPLFGGLLKAAPKSGSSPSSGSNLTSTGPNTEERLRTMSTGRMEGFGSDRCGLVLAARNQLLLLREAVATPAVVS